jgi:hypothetical protein
MAEKKSSKSSAPVGKAVVKDWSSHPLVAAAKKTGNVSDIEKATKQARDDFNSGNSYGYEGPEVKEVKIKDLKPPKFPERPPKPAPEIPNFPSKMMFGEGDLYDAIRRPYTYENKKYEIPYFENKAIGDSFAKRYGPYAQNPAPSFPEFIGFNNEEYARGVAQGGLRNYSPDYKLPYPFNERAKDFGYGYDNSYFLESKAFDRTIGNKLPFYLAGTTESYPYKY